MNLANKIQFELMRFVRGNGYDIVIPNFYYGMYEMDLFRLTNSEIIYFDMVKSAPLLQKKKDINYKSLAKSLAFREQILRGKSNYWKRSFERINKTTANV